MDKPSIKLDKSESAKYFKQLNDGLVVLKARLVMHEAAFNIVSNLKDHLESLKLDDVNQEAEIVDLIDHYLALLNI